MSNITTPIKEHRNSISQTNKSVSSTHTRQQWNTIFIFLILQKSLHCLSLDSWRFCVKLLAFNFICLDAFLLWDEANLWPISSSHSVKCEQVNYEANWRFPLLTFPFLSKKSQPKTIQKLLRGFSLSSASRVSLFPVFLKIIKIEPLIHLQSRL